MEYNLIYKLLDNNTGVILTRQPMVLPKHTDDELLFTFRDAPDGASAIFDFGNGASYYRMLSAGQCSLPILRLSGTIRVTVAQMCCNDAPLQQWRCEAFVATPTPQGGVLIAPNDMNLPQEVVNLRIEFCEIRREFENLRQENQKLNERVQSIMEGYDLI